MYNSAILKAVEPEKEVVVLDGPIEEYESAALKI
jgi:hypothetical protein